MEKTSREKCIVYIVSAIMLVISVILPYFIFKKVLLTGQHDLYDQISLGAVLVGMASAIITVATSHMGGQYDRVMLDVDILFNDLTGPGAWRRWPFLHRHKTRKLLSGEVIESTLKNPQIEFDLGTHIIAAYIPTCLSDFFDLPAFSTFSKMLKNGNKFHSYIVQKKISGIVSPDILQEDTTGTGMMVWDCMYDIWRTIVLYRLEKFMIHFFAAFIFSSVLLSFLFSQTTIIIN